MSEPTWVELGRAIRAHGVRGELRVHPEPLDVGALLVPGRKLRATLRSGEVRSLTVGESVRPIHDAVLITLAELAEREEVQALAGATLEIRVEDLPRDEADPYLFEFQGAQVVDESGSSHGRAVEIVDNGGQELLVIEGPAGEERLLPLVDETFVRLELDPHRVVIRPIPGLWDDTP